MLGGQAAFNNTGSPEQMQAMQNKLASIYGNTNAVQQQQMNSHQQQQQQQQLQMNSHQQQQQQQQQHQTHSSPQEQKPLHAASSSLSPKVPGKKGGYDPSNPRRKLPPSLERQNSLESIKFERIFNAEGKEIVSPRYSKAKYEMATNGDLQMSVMSLSIGDMDADENLSSVFNDSLRISSTANGIDRSELLEASANMAKRRSTKVADESIKSSIGWSDPAGFDMSVNTLGADMKDMNNMSFAMNNSMTSFSGAFDEAEK
jgi:hypothetical protein